MFNLFASNQKKKSDDNGLVPKIHLNIPAKHLPIETMTAQAMADAVHKRIDNIQKEFVDGFSFVQSYPKSVTFFGSARLPETDPHYQQARRLGALLAKEGYAVIT